MASGGRYEWTTLAPFKKKLSFRGLASSMLVGVGATPSCLKRGALLD